MIRIVTRHLTREILAASLLLLGGLVLLLAFFDLVRQAGSIGSRYSFWTALQLTALVIPSRAYEVLPIAALLGAVYTLSRWARDSEFTVLRSSGLSPLMLSRMLCVPALLLVLLTYGVGEFVAPAGYQMRGEIEAEALNRQVTARGFATGVWMKDIYHDASGKEVSVRFLNVASFQPGREIVTGAWRVFEFTPDQGRLLRILHSAKGRYIEGRGWLLEDVTVKTLPVIPRDTTGLLPRTRSEHLPQLLLDSQMTPSVLGVLTLKPERMSIRALHTYIEHLEETQQAAERYSVTMWNRIFYPLAIFAMLALSMPFAYLNVRSGGMSLKIFAGLMAGIIFYALNSVFSFLGVLNTWPAFLSAAIPTLAMTGLAAAAVWKLEKR